MKKLSIILLLLSVSLLGNQAFAQQNNNQKPNFIQNMQNEEIKIGKFIDDHMKLPFPQAVLDAALENDHDHREIPISEIAVMTKQVKRNYYRQLYFKEHPNAAAVYNPGSTHLSPNSNKNALTLVCTDGDFEDGVADLATYMGFGGDSSYYTQTGVCAFIPNTTSTLPNSGFGNTNHFQITNNIPDPLIPSINQTNNSSSHAIRINAPTPCPYPYGDVNMLQKTFTTTTNGIQTISFSYALVMEDPSHGQQNPFFVARILDGAGVEQDRICRVADASNTAFYDITPAGTGGSCAYTTIVSRDWTCESLTFNGNTNQTYTIEFFVADCAQGGHFAYAYIDDICVDCVPDTCNSPGSIVLQPTDTCDKTMTVCASYTPPVVNCVTGTINPLSPTLTILQGGVPTGIVLTGATVNTVTQTICFNVTPADFGILTGGFDFYIEADFNLGGTVTLDDTHTNPGQDNDYTTNPCDNCDCGSWSNVIVSELQKQQSILIGSYPCNIGIAQSLEAGHTYQFFFNYNCNPNSKSCQPTYTVTEDLNGIVTTQAVGGGLIITIKPNATDCGIRNITVTPTCDGKQCPPCGLSFFVKGCHECVEPVNERIYCDSITGKPIVEFCLTNLTSQNRSFYGITMPAGVSFTNLTSTSDATLIYNSGMMVFQTSSPIPPNGTACTFRFQIDGGIYKGQDLCIDLKSFTYYNSQGQFLNCCVDPVPLCLTIPDCEDDCADIVDARIDCINGQRVLRYKIKNNFYAQLDAYESFTVNGTPADYFFGFFGTPVLLGNTSPWISHVLPNTIAGGSTYCFTNTVHMYYSNGHPCDSICYTDTVCLTVPYCGIIHQDTIKYPDTKHGLNKKSNDGGGIESLSPEKRFLIYPNPVDNIVNIKSQSVDSRISSIVLTDITGKTIIREDKDNLILHRLDVSKLPSGIYLLRINNEKNYKIVKQE